MKALTEIDRAGRYAMSASRAWNASQIVGKYSPWRPASRRSSRHGVGTHSADTRRSTTVFPLCATNGISQIVWSSLAQGVLAGEYLPGQATAKDSRMASEQVYWLMQRHNEGVLDPTSNTSTQSPTASESRWRNWRSPKCSASRASRPRSSAPRARSRSERTPQPPGSKQKFDRRSTPHCRRNPRQTGDYAGDGRLWSRRSLTASAPSTEAIR